MDTTPSPVAAQSAAPCATRNLLPLPAWLVLAAILLTTCVVYWPAMRGQILWDDDEHIPGPRMRSVGGLLHIWIDPWSTQQYYPLLFSTFWLQHQLWGDDMLGYHVVSLLEHLLVVCLLYAVLRKLDISGALLATALFALHPVIVESVAWVTEQKNTLSGIFYFGAMLAYLHFDTSRKLSLYYLALVLFIAAVLSKTTAVTLPPVLLIIFWWQRGTLSWWRDTWPLVPFFLAALADGLGTILVERKILNAEGPEFELHLLQAILLSGRGLWFYLSKLIWPDNLIFIYPRWVIDPSVWWQWLFPLAAVAALGGLWALRSRSRAPLAGALIFIVTLLPVLGFLNVFFFRYTFVSDHFQYLACLGIVVPAAAGLVLGLQRLRPVAQATGGLACVALIGVLATLSWRQSHLYGGDIVSLYTKTLEQNPDCAMIYSNLGLIEFENGQLQQSFEHLQQALRVQPTFAEAHNNLGTLLLYSGRTPEAIEHLEEALRLKPKFAAAENSLGYVLAKVGRLPEAIKHYELALALNPDFADAHNNLGNALVDSHRSSEAIHQYEQALQANPDFADAHNNMGGALFAMGRRQEAIEQFKEALRISPTYASGWANLARAHAQMDHPSEAIAAAEQALELARAQGMTNLVQQLESSLAEYRASQADAPADVPAAALPPTAP